METTAMHIDFSCLSYSQPFILPVIKRAMPGGIL